MDSEELRGVESILKGHYAQVDAVMVLTPLQTLQADDVVRAIDAHVLDTTERDGTTVGHWPPKASDLLLRVRAGETKPPAQSTLAPRGRHATVAVSAEMQRRFGLSEEIRVYKSHCTECGDSGMARYYYDPTDSRRCFLGHEALELSDGEIHALRISQAICDCRTGERDHRRELMVENRNTRGMMTLYPRIETIRAISATRQRWIPRHTEEQI